MKHITKFKRLFSGVLSAIMTVSSVPIVSVHAEENSEPYPYTLFASSSDDGAITVNADNFSVNGNVATNGTIISGGNVNVNGTKTESAEESMIFIFDKIDNQYFSNSNVDEHDEDYILDEMNININVPTEVQGEATLTGNININNALKALEDVNLYGEVKNTNDSVIFSKYGDIVIDSQNVNLNGLVYAPFGSVTINAQNLNLNNVVIIAESIVLTCPSVNANNSSNASSFVGTTSEPLDIPYDEWQYMKDENENDFPDFFEDFDNWGLLKDTDGDMLPDCVEQFLGTDANLTDTDGDMLDDYYEIFVTGTDPTLTDTDSNGIADGEEDFDSDGLTNYQEYIQGTSPWNSDSDNDNLSDGDEVNNYGTNPLEPDTDFDGLNDADEIALGTNPNLPDTDGNGIIDSEEKFEQTYVYDVENEDCAVEQVIVSMEGTGNLQSTMSVENIMDKDVICSGVVGLVGVPFSIETTSDFETATLSFRIDNSKLGDTDFNNLLFLWYDEDNYQFVELETSYDEINSLVSIETTHFSRYMVVDKNKWFEAWAVDFNYNPAEKDPHAPTFKYNTVLAIDCSGSMDGNDKISTNSGIDSPYEALFPKTCQRIEAATQFIKNMNSSDKAAVVLFTSNANTVQSMTSNQEDLKLSLQNITSSGGTDFYSALTKSYNTFEESSFSTSYTNNRIILLSDGEDGSYSRTLSLLHSIYDEDSTDKRKSVKIYTIGLGTSYDSRLEEIANISHGEFFKAYTADELVDIYTKIGISGDFDDTDTDGDGLYDAVEAAGIRIQNGMILRNNPETDTFFSNPAVPDTDNDGLKDGEEIDPTIRCKNLLWAPPELNTDKRYYFFMKSDPSCEDSDGDGIFDLDEYVNVTTDSRYDTIHPLKTDTVETLYPEFSSVNPNNPIYITVSENNIIINANIEFVGDTDVTPSGFYKTYKETVIEGIKEHWEISFIGNTYDFYPGMAINVTVNINDDDSKSKSFKIKIYDEEGGSYRKGGKWTQTKMKYILLNLNAKSFEEVKSVSAHEFGHNLGLKDAYGAAECNHGYAPTMIDFNNPQNNEIWYARNGTPHSSRGLIMWMEGYASSNDIEMVLQAFIDDEIQYFVPFGKKQHISKAIKSGDNVYVNKSDGTVKYYQFDYSKHEFSLIGDANAYKTWVETNYGIILDIGALNDAW